MEATKKFGMFGSGWGVRDNHIYTLGDGIGQVVVYQATLFWKLSATDTGEFTIEASCKLYSAGGKVDDDAVKKAATDALTKGLSKLGFNADVFLGKFDDSKYVEVMKEKIDKEETMSQKETALKLLSEVKSKSEVISIWTNNPSLKTDTDFKKAVKEAGERFPDPTPEQAPTTPEDAVEPTTQNEGAEY
jgi:hypothetical protein